MDRARKLPIWLLLCLPALVTLLNCYWFAELDGYSHSSMATEDQGAFQRIGISLAEGGAYSCSTDPEKPFCPVRAPGVPVVFAACRLVFGARALTAIRILQVIALLATVLLLAYLAAVLAGHPRPWRTTLWIGLVIAILPHPAATTRLCQSEAFSMFGAALLVACACWPCWTGRVRWRWRAVALGIVSAALILTRPAFMLLPLLAYAHILLLGRSPRRQRIWTVLLSAGVLIAGLLPWALVNYQHRGRLAVAHPAVGFKLTLGIPELADHLDLPIPDDPAVVLPEMRRWFDDPGRAPLFDDQGAPTPQTLQFIRVANVTFVTAWQYQRTPAAKDVQMSDAFLQRLAIAWILDNPLTYAGLVIEHVPQLLFGEYQPLVYCDVGSAVLAWTEFARYALYLVFVVGSIVCVRRRAFRLLIVPWGIFLYLLAIHIPMHVESRYLVQAHPFFPMVLACIGARATQPASETESVAPA